MWKEYELEWFDLLKMKESFGSWFNKTLNLKIKVKQTELFIEWDQSFE
jgi:hypothetical protein